jgi:hypothetical protein
MIIISQIIEKIGLVSNTIIVSFYIIFVGLLFASVFEKFTRFILGELRINKFLKQGFNFKINIEKIVSKSVYYFFFIFTIILSLNNIGLTWYVVLSWSLFIIVIFSLSLALDLKDAIINFYYGLKLKDKIRKGNFIETEIISGKVVKKNLVSVTILFDGEEHYIPNIFLSQGYMLKLSN